MNESLVRKTQALRWPRKIKPPEFMNPRAPLSTVIMDHIYGYYPLTSWNAPQVFCECLSCSSPIGNLVYERAHTLAAMSN